MESVKVSADQVVAAAPLALVAEVAASCLSAARADGLSVRRLEDLDTLIVSKDHPGFDYAALDGVRQIVRDARAGLLGRLKFLVFDFAHDQDVDGDAVDGFDGLIIEVANLILAAPIVTVACARARVGGADLELALACSMMIGEDSARFSFAADPIVAIGTYGFLAQKIGFVRAERLMEDGEELDAQQMHDMLLLKAIAPAGAGLSGVEAFVHKALRRHNASYGIYRAQRIASPLRLSAVA